MVITRNVPWEANVKQLWILRHKKMKTKREKNLIENLKYKQPVEQVALCAKAYEEWQGADKERAGRMLDYYDNVNNYLGGFDIPVNVYDYLDTDEFYTCPATGCRVALDGTILND